MSEVGELDNWKLVVSFLYLHCFDWRRIKFDVNIVRLIQNSFQGHHVSLGNNDGKPNKTKRF